jgi:CubicO group peptidase (beta-lactamase class C family)
MVEKLKKFIDRFNRCGFNLNNIRIDFSTDEFYEYELEPNIKLNLHSCAKTITSIAIGICLYENLLSLEDFFLDYFPEYKQKTYNGTKEIKIKHLLQMTAGKELRSLLSDTNVESWTNDWLVWFIEYPLSWIPGKHFYYSAHCSYVLGRVIEKVTGKTVNEFLDSKLWKIIGIEKPYWDTCPQGHTICAGNIYLSCEELSKIGLMLLNYGKLKGKRILEPIYVKNMIQDIVPSQDSFFEDFEGSFGYGYSIWKCSRPNTFRIWGAGGNYCILDYYKNIVITITAKTDLQNWKRNNDNNILREAYNVIL